MLTLIEEMKKYGDDFGLKQKSVAEKAEMDEVKFCLAFQGKNQKQSMKRVS